VLYAHALVRSERLCAARCIYGPYHRNTQIEDTCIVFKQWHISSHFIFALSFLAIILISLGYEYLREYQRLLDRRIALALSRSKARGKGSVSGRSTPEQSGPEVEEAGLLSGKLKVSNWYALVLILLRSPNIVSSLVRRFHFTLAFCVRHSMAFRFSCHSS
jgi:hypothetical protein